MSKIKPIAFYLPQFHRVKENDEWWGRGFTEWTNVAKGKPNFSGHYQPHVPKDMGFYDLKDVENMRDQAELARAHGIYGFCFYYYRFKDGRRILEKPLNNYVKSDIDFPFCYCWANENWTKTWDGLDKEILLEQNHGGEDDVLFIKELLETFKDDRYIKVDGKPMVVVYRADLLVNPIELTNKWRQLAKEQGFPDLHLCAVQFYGIDDPAVFGFDAAVEFPPHKFIGPENRPDNPVEITNPEFRGGIVDFKKVIGQSLKKCVTDYKCYRGIVPSWDNTARRQDTGHILINSSPKLYKFWLSYLADYTKENFAENEQFVFINAWNEWAEGAHLEPDLKYGSAYLEATLSVVNNKKLDIKDYVFNENIFSFISKNLSQAELTQINQAFSLAQYGLADERSSFVDQVTNNSNLRKRDYIKLKYPSLYSFLLPFYIKLRKVL